MDRAQVEEAAAFLFHLRVQRETAAALPHEISPASVDDAYAIQDVIHEAAGWPIGVVKVGATSAAAQTALGIPHPIAGRIPAESVFHSGALIPVSFFGREPAIECEIAFQVDEHRRITAVAPAIELVDPRIQSDGTFGGMATIADNAAGCAVVLGDPTPLDPVAPGSFGEIGAFDETVIELTVGDTIEPIATGSGAAVLGGPLTSVEWIVAHEAARGRSIPAGGWIITGTCTGITPSTFGTTYQARFSGLGEVAYSTG